MCFTEHRYEDAQLLLDRALEFNSRDSECYFLLYRIHGGDRAKSLASLEYLDNAIAGGSWYETEPSLAGRERGRVLLQIRRFDEAVQELSMASRQRFDDVEVPILLARSLVYSGDISGAIDVVRLAVQQFPANPTLNIYFAYYLNWKNGVSSALDFLDLVSRQLPGEPQIYLESAFLADEAERKALYLRKFFETGGKDPRAPLIAVEAGLEPTEDHLRRFFTDGGNRHLDLLERLYKAVGHDEHAQSLLEEMAAGYDGERIVDSDWDGFSEERHYFVNGALSSVHLDRNQDGRPEMVVHLSEGQIVAASLFEDNPSLLTDPGATARRECKLLYHPYPYLTQVVYKTASEVRTYEIEPTGFEHALPVSRSTFPGGIKLPDRASFIEERMALAQAYTLNVHSRSGEKAWDLLDGTVVRFTADHRAILVGHIVTV